MSQNSAATAVSTPDEAGSSCVCRMLRTKTAFGSLLGHMHHWQEGNSTTAVYWCLKTMETVGPDDGFAHPHKCSGTRGCFESEAI
jgi:hypothetical protein